MEQYCNVKANLRRPKNDLNAEIIDIAKKDGFEKINRRLTAGFSEGPSSDPQLWSAGDRRFDAKEEKNEWQ